MDYDTEMLRLYFKEKKFTKEEIKKLLRDNPFDENYVIWEKIKLNNNKTLGIELRRNGFINYDDPIQEITNNAGNSICSSVSANVCYRICKSNDDIRNTYVSPGLVVINGLFSNEVAFLKRLKSRNIDFVKAYCTRDEEEHERNLRYLEYLAESVDASYVHDYKKGVQKICLLKK